MRDFDDFLDFCRDGRAAGRFSELAYKGAYERILGYTNNNHDGHFIQLFYAIYDFFTLNPSLKNQVTSPPFEIKKNRRFLNEWRSFLSNNINSCSDYQVNLVREKLPSSCGGNLTGGGGWSPTAKILFPVVALYHR